MIYTMFDLETLGLTQGDAILQIGAIKFDEKFNILDRFEVNIDPLDSATNGFTADRSTIDWWANQSQEARGSVSSNVQKLLPSLKAFSDFAIGTKCWCHANFDYPMISYAMKKMRVMQPFKYFEINDLRTIQFLSGLDSKKAEILFGRTGKHTALADSEFQLGILKVCLERLGLQLP